MHLFGKNYLLITLFFVITFLTVLTFKKNILNFSLFFLSN